MEEEAERKVKRLRGWKLEQAKLEGSPCEKDAENHSALCTRLLELWSQGKLSACQVAELSHLAVLDGCASQELVSLAKCGNWGNSKANAHRDLVALHCSSMQLCEPTPASRMHLCFCHTFSLRVWSNITETTSKNSLLAPAAKASGRE